MNFQDLYKKIRNIEEGVIPVEECGMPMPMSAPGQQDSVTMSVNMNGNGSGGIKDLMNILKNIEQGANPMNPHPHDAERLFGDGYENSEQGDEGAVTLDIKDIMQTGNDMHSQGHEAPKVNGGGNPMQEALVSRLAQMYDEMKEAYNPNSVGAEHRRSLEKSHEDSLKKKAEAGDESAKKRLQALKDKKERMANDYNDRMER